MSATSDVTITRAPNAHGGAQGGAHAQSSLGNGIASQVPTASLGQRIFDRPNKDKVGFVFLEKATKFDEISILLLTNKLVFLCFPPNFEFSISYSSSLSGAPWDSFNL